jgi:hypothetical protein
LIHKIRDYNATLTSPDVTGHDNREVIYEPLTEKVIVWPSDADEIRRQLLLVLNCKERPLVVVFTPRRRKDGI